jgi:hypothetical protein
MHRRADAITLMLFSRMLFSLFVFYCIFTEHSSGAGPCGTSPVCLCAAAGEASRRRRRPKYASDAIAARVPPRDGLAAAAGALGRRPRLRRCRGSSLRRGRGSSLRRGSGSPLWRGRGSSLRRCPRRCPRSSLRRGSLAASAVAGRYGDIGGAAGRRRILRTGIAAYVCLCRCVRGRCILAYTGGVMPSTEAKRGRLVVRPRCKARVGDLPGMRTAHWHMLRLTRTRVRLRERRSRLRTPPCVQETLMAPLGGGQGAAPLLATSSSAAYLERCISYLGPAAAYSSAAAYGDMRRRLLE